MSISRAWRRLEKMGAGRAVRPAKAPAPASGLTRGDRLFRPCSRLRIWWPTILSISVARTATLEHSLLPDRHARSERRPGRSCSWTSARRSPTTTRLARNRTPGNHHAAAAAVRRVPTGRRPSVDDDPVIQPEMFISACPDPRPWRRSECHGYSPSNSTLRTSLLTLGSPVAFQVSERMFLPSPTQDCAGCNRCERTFETFANVPLSNRVATNSKTPRCGSGATYSALRLPRQLRLGKSSSPFFVLCSALARISNPPAMPRQAVALLRSLYRRPYRTQEDGIGGGSSASPSTSALFSPNQHSDRNGLASSSKLSASFKRRRLVNTDPRVVIRQAGGR